MIISFTRGQRCVRCKRPEPGKKPIAFMEIQPWRWLGFRFRICQHCADEMAERLARMEDR